MNLHIPQKYGGLELNVFDTCLIFEELSSFCSGIATSLEASNLGQVPLILAGTEKQKREFLSPLIEKPQLSAYCVTEPQAGSDVQGIQTRAQKKGSSYILNGSKMWITNGGVASWYFVLAYTDPKKGSKGMTGFILPSQTSGIEVGKKEMNLGQRCSDTRSLHFTNVEIPENYRLGQEGEGFKIAMKTFDHTRPPTAASAVGVAKAAFNHAMRYCTERKTFGRPLFEHQAISFMIANMAIQIEAARGLVWKAAFEIDQGRRNTLSAAQAKAFAADMCNEVCTNAVQVFGGYGYNEEYPVEKLYRDSKIFQIYEGTSQIQRLIIAKELFQRLS